MIDSYVSYVWSCEEGGAALAERKVKGPGTGETNVQCVVDHGRPLGGIRGMWYRCRRLLLDFDFMYKTV